MNQYESIMAKISTLQKKASSLRDNKKRQVIADIRKQIDLYEIQSAELFSETRRASIASIAPAIASRPLAKLGKIAKSGKRVLPPKYRDPATGKTWNGHGKRPLWLVGDRDTFLINPQAAAASDGLAPPKKRGRPARVKPLEGGKSTLAKAMKKKGRPQKRTMKRASPVAKPEAPSALDA